VAGGGGHRVLRPGMLRIATAHVLAHVRIGVGPEALQIAGHRQRPSGGREQVDQDGVVLRADRWSLGLAEKGLELGRQDRTRIGSVVEPGLLAGREFEARRVPAIQGQLLWIVHSAPERAEPVDAGKILPAAVVGQKWGQPVIEGLEQCVVIEGGPLLGVEPVGELGAGPPLSDRVRPVECFQAAASDGGKQSGLKCGSIQVGDRCFVQHQFTESFLLSADDPAARFVPIDGDLGGDVMGKNGLDVVQRHLGGQEDP